MRRKRKKGGPGDKGGRPTRFTTAVAVALTRSLMRHERLVDAARQIGVGKTTAYRWLASARDGDPRYSMLVGYASLVGYRPGGSGKRRSRGYSRDLLEPARARSAASGCEVGG
jgi:hypothetical protein